MRLSARVTTFLLFTGIVLAAAVPLRAQNFDFESYPKLDFRFNSLSLELTLNEDDRLLEGTAEYRLEANRSDAGQIVLNAGRLDITQILLNGEESEYSVRNDSLLIELPEPASRNEEFTMSIEYDANPTFGLHREGDGTLWTSTMPLSVRHWLPVADHPRVRMETEIRLLVPGDYRAAASGVRTHEEILSTEQKAVSFRSEEPLPVTALGFAAGRFERERTSFGIKNIHLSHPRGLLKEGERRSLLRQAYDILEDSEKYLGREYPFEDLDVIVLENSNWEYKNYAAGWIYLFEDQGDVETQLRRGIYAQWFGVRQREEQWENGLAQTLLQVDLFRERADTVAYLDTSVYPEAAEEDPYKLFSPAHWNDWQFTLSEDSSNFEVLDYTDHRGLLELGEGVFNWDDYARYWYRVDGNPRFEQPRPMEYEPESESRADSVIYEVVYDYNEAENEIRLQFSAADSVLDELVSVPMYIYRNENTDTLEVTFTGGQDTVVMPQEGTVRHAELDPSGVEHLYFQEEKPADFLLFALRNLEDQQKRALAAHQLRHHSGNPDLQLAITDLLRNEENTEVRAGLITALGSLTGDASGTHQMFLDELEGADEIQQAALKALSVYEGNDSVVQTLQQYALDADSTALFRQAVTSLARAQTDSSAFEEFVGQLVENDTTGERSLFALEMLLERGETGSAVERLDYLLSDEFPMEVRATAIELLSTHDDSAERWAYRLENLLEDPNPAIRYRAVRAGAQEAEGIQELLRNHVADEFDGRVYFEIQRVLE